MKEYHVMAVAIQPVLDIESELNRLAQFRWEVVSTTTAANTIIIILVREL